MRNTLSESELNSMLFTLSEYGYLYINNVHKDQVEEFLKSRNIKIRKEENPLYTIFRPHYNRG